MRFSSLGAAAACWTARLVCTCAAVACSAERRASAVAELARERSIAAMDWAEAELALEMFMALRGCSKSSRKNPIAATSFPSHCALVFHGNFEFPKIKLTSQDVVSIFPPSGIRHNIYALPQVWNN
jgi:hypothetical protein